MTSLLLLAMLAAGPRAPADADFSFYLPRLDAAGELTPWLDAAGEHSGLLRREGWRNDVHPLLGVDVTRLDSLREAGLDPAGSATLSLWGGASVSCVPLADPKKYEAACGERLKSLGELWRKEVDGVAVVGAKDPIGRVLAGYVLRGKESCALGGGGASVEKPLLELGRLLGKAPAGASWKTAGALPGQALLVAPFAVVALKGAGLTVVLAQATAQVSGLCPGCDRAALGDAATALAPLLTGQVLVFLQQVKVMTSLRTVQGRLFAVRGALLAEATDPAAARAALEALATLKGVKPLENGEGFALAQKEGRLELGVRAGHVYLSDDAAALEAVFKALGSRGGKQAHGTEFGLDPQRLARALGQVPMMDVLAVPELAAVLAVSAEAGPLLLASERLGGWADGDATSLKGHAEWKLKDARDAGR